MSLLLECRRPVNHYGDGHSRGLLYRHADEEPSVFTDVEPRVVRSEPHVEQRSRNIGVGTATGSLDLDRHHLVIGADEEEFLTITAPNRDVAAIGRDLPLAPGDGKVIR